MMQGAGSARDESWEDGMNRRRGESWARCNGPTRGAVCLCEVTQADLWIAEMAELIERNQAELRALYLHSLLAENKCEVPGCETCGGPDKIERFDPSIDLCDPDKRAAHFAKLDGLEYATSPYVAPGSKTMEAPAGWTRVLTCGLHEILEACELPYSTHGFTEVSLYLDERGNVRAIVGNP